MASPTIATGPPPATLAGAKAAVALPHRPAKLRTKTGCLTCRSRRKKCDEQSPICGRCSQSNRECLWPSSADLVDRRYTTHTRFHHAAGAEPVEEKATTDPSVESSLAFRLSESVAQSAISHDLEAAVTRHFTNRYSGLLLLPNCHPDYFNGWMLEIQELMGEWKCVRYAVLCNAASNLHFIESNGKMQELALTYYSQALRGLSDLLGRAEPLASSNSVLLSMMLLYLHGCMGRGTYFDVPRHLNAATRVLALRLFKQTPIIGSLFDRLAVESVLYQIFLVSTGLWSDENVNRRLEFDFDLDFWLRAEKLINESSVFPGQSSAMNSPVLGAPVGLFRLALTVKQMYQGAVTYTERTLKELRIEIKSWESFVLYDKDTDQFPHTEPRNHKDDFYKNASYLFILIISLLFTQLTSPRLLGPSSHLDPNTSSLSAPQSRPPLAADPNCWQIQKAIQILKSYQTDYAWASSFLGNWPVYSIGFFMARPEHIQLVRNDLRRRWDLTKFNQSARYLHDLDRTWAARGLLVGGEVKPATKSLQTKRLEEI